MSHREGPESATKPSFREHEKTFTDLPRGVALTGLPFARKLKPDSNEFLSPNQYYLLYSVISFFRGRTAYVSRGLGGAEIACGRHAIRQPVACECLHLN